MKRNYHTCDQCDKRIDYTDADGDYYVSGISLKGNKVPVTFRVHTPSNCGYSGVPIKEIWQEHLCSPECLQKTFDVIVEQFRESWETRNVDIVDGNRVERLPTSNPSQN